MKQFYVFLVVVLFPILAFSETLFLKDGTNINTNIYWEENQDKIGYFLGGKPKYIKKDLIDWNKTKEKHALTNNEEDISNNSIFNEKNMDKNSIVEDMKLYLKSIDIINKYGSPETLSKTNNVRWVAYFPKGDFTIITDKKSNTILKVINGRGF